MPIFCQTCRMLMGRGNCPECDRVHNERVALVEKLDRESGAAAERARLIREDMEVRPTEPAPAPPEDQTNAAL